MDEAKRRGTFEARKANPKGDGRRTRKVPDVDVAETSVPTRQMARRFGFKRLVKEPSDET